MQEAKEYKSGNFSLFYLKRDCWERK